MSSNPEAIGDQLGDPVDGLPPTEARRSADAAAFLQEIDDDGEIVREVKPDVVMRFGGTLPFDADSTQLQDGQTVTDARGDENIRLNMEMGVGYVQFQKVAAMRASDNQIKVISPSYSGPATFDQIKYDRIPDANGIVTDTGEAKKEARYVVQLQSKEQSEDDSIIDPFSDD